MTTEYIKPAIEIESFLEEQQLLESSFDSASTAPDALEGDIDGWGNWM